MGDADWARPQWDREWSNPLWQGETRSVAPLAPITFTHTQRAPVRTNGWPSARTNLTAKELEIRADLLRLPTRSQQKRARIIVGVVAVLIAVSALIWFASGVVIPLLVTGGIAAGLALLEKSEMAATLHLSQTNGRTREDERERATAQPGSDDSDGPDRERIHMDTIGVTFAELDRKATVAWSSITSAHVVTTAGSPAWVTLQAESGTYRIDLHDFDSPPEDIATAIVDRVAAWGKNSLR